MQLVDITTTNFYILMNIIDVKNQNQQAPLMPTVPSVLNRVVIKIELSNVRLLELIPLKRFGTITYGHPKAETIESVKSFVDGLHLAEGSDSFFYSLQDCFFECPTIEKDENRSILHYETMPVGFPEFDCTLTLSGEQILSLYGYDLYKITTITKPTQSLEKNIEINIYSAIYDTVFKEVIQAVTLGNDLITGAWLNTNIYHRFPETEELVLASIIGDYGHVISFVDTTPENLTKEIEDAKNSKNENFKVEFTCNTSLNIYYYLKLFLGIQISDEENLQVTLADDCKLANLSISKNANPVVKNYNAGYVKYDCIKSADILTNLFMLPAARKISYSIILTELELNQICESIDHHIAIQTEENLNPNQTLLNFKPVIQNALKILEKIS